MKDNNDLEMDMFPSGDNGQGGQQGQGGQGQNDPNVAVNPFEWITNENANDVYNYATVPPTPEEKFKYLLNSARNELDTIDYSVSPQQLLAKQSLIGAYLGEAINIIDYNPQLKAMFPENYSEKLMQEIGQDPFGGASRFVDDAMIKVGMKQPEAEAKAENGPKDIEDDLENLNINEERAKNDGDFSYESNKKDYDATAKILYDMEKIINSDMDDNQREEQLKEKKDQLKEQINQSPAVASHMPDDWDARLERDIEKKDNKAVRDFVLFNLDKFDPTRAEKKEDLEEVKDNDKNINPSSNSGDGDENEDDLEDLIDPQDLEKTIANFEAEKEKLRKEREALDAERAKFEAEQKEIREGKKDLPEINGRKIKQIKTVEDVLKDRSSPDRGYQDSEIKNDLTETQFKDVKKLKYMCKKANTSVKKSPQFKKMMKSLEELDTFMEQIRGRTNLTAEEMEIYDRLSLKAYRASKEYKEHKMEQREKRFENAKVDEKTGKKVGEDDYYDKEDQYRIKLADKIMTDVQNMRQEMFQNQLDKKAEEMKAKCEEEVSKCSEARENMAASVGNDAEMLQDNVANTLYYQNRMDQLKKAGDLKLKPGETLSMAMKRLDKSTEPKMSEIAKIKSTNVTKDIVINGLKNPDKAVTNEDIDKAYKAEIQKMAGKKKKAPVIKKKDPNAELKKKDPNAGKNAPGM